MGAARLVRTSILFPGHRPAVFDDIPTTEIAIDQLVAHVLALR